MRNLVFSLMCLALIASSSSGQSPYGYRPYSGYNSSLGVYGVPRYGAYGVYGGYGGGYVYRPAGVYQSIMAYDTLQQIEVNQRRAIYSSSMRRWR